MRSEKDGIGLLAKLELIISKAKKMGGNRILQRRNIPPMYEIYYHRNRLFE